MDLMDAIKERIQDLLASEPAGTRVLITLTETCGCRKQGKCNVCAGRGYVMDAANISGKSDETY